MPLAEPLTLGSLSWKVTSCQVTMAMPVSSADIPDLRSDKEMRFQNRWKIRKMEFKNNEAFGKLISAKAIDRCLIAKSETVLYILKLT